jgi:hypothetical protein
VSPRQSVDALQSLDRRLVAVEGDVASRLEHEFAFRAPGIAGTVKIPVGDEMARLEIELTAIAGELAAIGRACAIAVTEVPDIAVSRSDAEAAYDALRRHTAVLQRAVNDVTEALLTRHPELRASPVTEDVTSDEEPPGRWRRILGPKGVALFVAPVILALMYAAWRSDRNDLRAAATLICERPVACAGDAPELAMLRRSRLRGSTPIFVLHRASSDCRRSVEVYHSHDGSYLFRGSPDDPDPKQREKFLDQRARWITDHEETARAACTNLDDLF